MLALTQQTWAFAVVLVLVEVAGGSIDTAMNAEASHRLDGQSLGAGAPARALQRGRARAAPPSPGLRASTPGSPGAGLARGRRWWHSRSASGPSSPTRARPWRRPPARSDPATIDRAHPLRRLRRDGLLVLLAVFALAEVTEGGVDTWGVLYLRNHLATGVLLGAGAYVVGQLVAATTRGAGEPLLGRLSTRHALVIGGCVAGGGILLESLTSLSGVAALGLALGAGGASLFWPLVMSTVSRLASQVVSAVGAFTAAGYVGWVAGAPSSDGSPRPSGPPAASRSWPLASFGRRRVATVRSRPPDRTEPRDAMARGVTWVPRRHDPAQHRDARRRQGPRATSNSPSCARRSGPSSSTRSPRRAATSARTSAPSS